MSYVNLSGTCISDDDLTQLETLSDVDVLDLSGTSITDAGLVHLKRLGRLQMLVLDGTHVTPAGLSELRHALPGLAILVSKYLEAEASRSPPASGTRQCAGST